MKVAMVAPEPAPLVEAQRDLVPILLDLTYYEDAALVSAALGLLVRHFEQRKVHQGEHDLRLIPLDSA